jgi:hypothetical protein
MDLYALTKTGNVATQEKKVRKSFYSNQRFRSIDKALRKAYFWKNPYRISKEFLIKKGEGNIHVYGETPLTTMELIARESTLTPSDFVFELGGGRGRGAFFLNALWGCRVKVFEWIDTFAEIGEKLADQYQCKDVFFSHLDYFHADLSEATWIYLYGTCLRDGEIEKLIHSFLKLPAATRIITVSYSLQEYSDDFIVLKQFTGSYPWGEADIYLNGRRSDDRSVKRD